ncbi:MAG: hypothetical protein KIY12_09220 [Thermoplasmata archaeon]|uniref:Uncharacterized protein n=1 Tax=Candidatus Sysuiplasma superficiale TaxID=2823368 RepID=A0A8J7YK28_9ARCH|nr:hypothetical protein [Candidatus Sysuiplasma superficiale]MBX8644880.1 hypothetical protein [Candidatus Sysuiplasma superficiale]MCL4347331.1 hypothetical protein [Candidatus Thermoplasmatota archaeon]
MDDTTIELFREEMSAVQRRLEAMNTAVEALARTVEENNRMLTAMAQALQQMGLIAQPYVKKRGEVTSQDGAYY